MMNAFLKKKTVFKRVIPNQIIDKSKSKTKLNFNFFNLLFFSVACISFEYSRFYIFDHLS